MCHLLIIKNRSHLSFYASLIYPFFSFSPTFFSFPLALTSYLFPLSLSLFPPVSLFSTLSLLSVPNLNSDLFDLQPAFIPAVQSTPSISTANSAWGGTPPPHLHSHVSESNSRDAHTQIHAWAECLPSGRSFICLPIHLSSHSFVFSCKTIHLPSFPSSSSKPNVAWPSRCVETQLS